MMGTPEGVKVVGSVIMTGVAVTEYTWINVILASNFLAI
jgi:hypothetical protein